MKIIKGLTIATMTLALSLVLSACGSSSPSEQVEIDLSEIKSAEVSSTIFESKDNSFSEEEKAAYSDFLAMVNDFDYEIVGEEISEDEKSATVSLNITTYDYGTAYLDAWDKVAAGKAKGESFYTLFFNEASKLEEKNFVTPIVVTCTKGDDGWKTDLASNAAFKSAIMGDLVSVITDLASM